jgi:cell division transport system ATP-binding protein
MPEAGMILKTENLTKIYPSGGGVMGINLQIERGEFVLLYGETGAGKSTLIKLIALLEKPDKGNLQLESMRAEELKFREYVRWWRRIGVIPQDLRLMPERNVFQNVATGLRGTGLNYKKSKQIGFKTLGQVGLAHRWRERVGNLSGGEARRTAIARAIAHEPFLLLADEPMGDLDTGTGQEIMKLFEKINQMGTSVLMVTHRTDVSPAVKFRRLEMIQGKLVV